MTDKHRSPLLFFPPKEKLGFLLSRETWRFLFKRFILWTIFLALIVTAFYVTVTILQKETFRKRATEMLNQKANAIHYKTLGVTFFPRPAFELKDLEVDLSRAGLVGPLRIRCLKAYFSWWGYFLGKFSPQGWTADGVHVPIDRLEQFKPLFEMPARTGTDWSQLVQLVLEGNALRLERLSVGREGGLWLTRSLTVDLRDLRHASPIRFWAKGRLANLKENACLSGKLWLDMLQPEQSKLELFVDLKNGDIPTLASYLGWKVPLQIEEGFVTTKSRWASRGSLRILRASGETKLSRVRFVQPGGVRRGKIASAVALYDVTFFLDEERLEIQTARLDLPRSHVSVEGAWDWSPEKGDYAFMVSSRRIGKEEGVDLEEVKDLLYAWVDFAAQPYQVNGCGRANLTVSREEGKFQLHLNTDLDRADLAWGNFFQKKAGPPLNFELRWGNRNEKGHFKGDFNVKLKGLNLKGSLSDWESKERRGELALHTNKVDVAPLRPFFPWLAQHEASGKVKVVTDAKGKLFELSQWSSLKYFVNATFSSFSAKWSDFEASRLSGFVGVENGNWEIRGLSWRSGTSQWKLNLIERKLKDQRDLRFLVSTTVFHADPYFKNPQKLWVTEPLRWFLAALGTVDQGQGEVLFEKCFLGGMENRMARLVLDLSRSRIETRPFVLNGFAGLLTSTAQIGLAKASPQVTLHVEGEGLDLEKWPNSKDYRGKLFLTADVSGDGKDVQTFQQTMQGTASVRIEKGKFPHLDFLKGFSQVSELQGLEPLAKGKTEFERFQTDLAFNRGRAAFQRFTLRTSDFLAQGKGSVGWDGTLDCEARVYPESFLCKKAFGNQYLMDESLVMPIWVSGTLENPVYRVDLKKCVGETFRRLSKRTTPSA